MQSEILEFEHDNKSFKLFGDFGENKIIYLDGIAHAFENSDNWILTFFSDTGVSNGKQNIASADLRLAISKNKIKLLIENLNTLLNKQSKSKEDKKEVESDRKTNETLGPKL